MAKHIIQDFTDLPLVTITEGKYKGVDYTGTFHMVRGYKDHAGEKAGGAIVVVENTETGQKRRVTVPGEGVGYTMGGTQADSIDVNDLIKAGRKQAQAKGLTIEDVASELGITVSAAKKRAARGTSVKTLENGRYTLA